MNGGKVLSRGHLIKRILKPPLRRSLGEFDDELKRLVRPENILNYNNRLKLFLAEKLFRANRSKKIIILI